VNVVTKHVLSISFDCWPDRHKCPRGGHVFGRWSPTDRSFQPSEDFLGTRFVFLRLRRKHERRNVSRLSRNLTGAEVILAQLRDAGCTVIGCDSGTDLIGGSDDEDPIRRLIRQVLGAVPEFDRRVTVLKLRAARERIRLREGRCECRKPIGSRPGEAKAVARVRELNRKPHDRKCRSLQ